MRSSLDEQQLQIRRFASDIDRRERLDLAVASLRGLLESFGGRPAITAHPGIRVMRKVFPSRGKPLAHAPSLCFFSSLTVLACGPFSPASSAYATRALTVRSGNSSLSTLFRWK